MKSYAETNVTYVEIIKKNVAYYISKCSLERRPNR